MPGLIGCLRRLVVRLKAGFGENGEDVDAFISFSLSVQNRRKSRVGHAFEGIWTVCSGRMVCGSSRDAGKVG